MNISYLDQTVELERGEAGVLWWAISGYGQRILALLRRQGLPAVVPADVVVALPALERAARRLKRLDERQQQHTGPPPRRPVKFRLKGDEVIAVVRYVVPTAHQAAWAVLGKVHQKSLNLEQYIKF